MRVYTKDWGQGEKDQCCSATKTCHIATQGNMSMEQRGEIAY